MISNYNRHSSAWFAYLPWWAWVVAGLLWLVGFATVCALTLAWVTVFRPLYLAADALSGHKISREVQHARAELSGPVDFTAARNHALSHHH